MSLRPFPDDLPDLLRLACGQGKMRLNVWHGSERGHQANLANNANGWTVEYDADPLEAIARVLRIRFGSMLERQRAAETVHIIKPPGGGTGTGTVVEADTPLGPSCFFCGRGQCEPGCPGLPDPVHPGFADAVAELTDIDVDGLIG